MNDATTGEPAIYCVCGEEEAQKNKDHAKPGPGQMSRTGGVHIEGTVHGTVGGVVNCDKTEHITIGTQIVQNFAGPSVLQPDPIPADYWTVPDLPENFISRPEAVAALRDGLLNDQGQESRGIALTAVQGMGGIGKTVLAKAVCMDEVVRKAFPDGIIWQSIGKESAFDLTTRMREVGKALKDDLSRYENELACKNQFRSLIAGKAALLVIDDVWRVEDIAPWLARSPRSRVLFTTRDTSIAASVGAREHWADLLSASQARELFTRWAGVPSGNLSAEGEGIIDECRQLPLALSMVGAMLRGKPADFWRRTLEFFRNADLARIKVQFPDYPYPNLFVAIQVSVDALEQTEKRCYLALAVLLEDMPAGRIVQETLWGANEGEAAEVAERFIALSLAQRDGSDGRSIRLHDLQLDYTRSQYSDQEALELIHGAVSLSSHVIIKDPSQFASQIVGRLLGYGGETRIRKFITAIKDAAPRPWLMTLWRGLEPSGGAMVRMLKGHSGNLSGVAMSADGKRGVSASWDHTLKVWDLESGRELRTLKGHSAYVNGVAVRADGKRGISASDDKTLKVWDLENGLELSTLKGHSACVSGVAMSADGRYGVSASWDRTLKVWDLEGERELYTLLGHAGQVEGVAMNADGTLAVSASKDRTLKVWDLENGQALLTLKGHSDTVRGVAMSADGKCAVSASKDRTVKVWDLESGRELRTLRGHSSQVQSVAISADSEYIVSASRDQTLKLWDLKSGRELRTLRGHSDYVNGVAISASRRRAVSASRDRALKVWDLKGGRKLRALRGHSGSVSDVAISADCTYGVSASWDDTLKVWNLRSGQELCTLLGHSNRVNGVAISADGKRAVSASSDLTLKVWGVTQGQVLRTLRGHSGSVTGVALSADGKRAISASHDRTLKVWDVNIGQELRTLRGHFDSVSGVAMSADGMLAISASHDLTLKMWDLKSWRELRTLKSHTGCVSKVAMSADCARAISASWDGTLKVWNLKSGQELCTLSGHSNFVNGAAMSAEGKRAVSCSRDHTLKVWDVDRGILLATFTCESPVLCCSISGSKTIVAGDAAGRIYLVELIE